jgi:hypothetical protein
VASLVNDLSHAVEERIREAFDLGKVAKEVYAKGALFSYQIESVGAGRLCVDSLFFNVRTF